jgi:DNA-binding response OmpR family regulator
MYILIIAEHSLNSSFLARGLKYENIESEAKSFFDDWEDQYYLNQFDAIICQFPQDDNLETIFLDKFKSNTFKCPFFFIIEKSKIKNIPAIQESPLYIYPSKITIRELAFEIKRVLIHKISSDISHKLQVADLILYPNTREAERFEKKFYLRNKEFQLLEFLMENTDIILSRQKILENVWDRNANMLTHTVDVHINALRKKIDNDPTMRLIETIFSHGYKMRSQCE